MTRRWATAVAVAVAVAVGIAGCGGSDDDSNTSASTGANTSTSTVEAKQLSAAEFNRQATEICQGVVDQVAGLGGGPRDRSIAASRTWAAQRGSIQDQGLTALAAIEPPARGQAAWDALRSVLRERRVTAESAQVKAVMEDPAVRRDLDDYNRQQVQIERLAGELRLRACVWL